MFSGVLSLLGIQRGTAEGPLEPDYSPGGPKKTSTAAYDIDDEEIDACSFASPAFASPTRTSTHAPFRSHCAERNCDSKYPVKLVVFDLDETLTLVSYMIQDDDTPEIRRNVIRIDFETPWVTGSRIAKLQSLFQDLIGGRDGGRKRMLAVLTRNGAGSQAVLQLLEAAKLSEYISAIWNLPWSASLKNGAYQEAGCWKPFDPPMEGAKDHKADVLTRVARDPISWLPQLANESEATLHDMLDLKLEGIVLVDDQRSNLQSDSGAQVLRYCKVARYDARYRNLGNIKNMGGIGAHSDADYDILRTFVEDPSMFKETLQLHCVERAFPTAHLKIPVTLVVFDFDETLTLATFMPEDDAYKERMNWTEAGTEDWSEVDLMRYNFESPYLRGNRLEKLRTMLKSLVSGADGCQRKLAVLTRNESGVIAVLNLLKMAKLAEFFSAIWTMPYSLHRPTGACREGDTWRCFETPINEVPDHKADLLNHVAQNPTMWFPQAKGDAPEYEALRRLSLPGIVLVDDERDNFQSAFDNQLSILRYCKVARYDDTFRNCGMLNQLGGIGAHSDDDYETLRAFIQKPWRFPQEPAARVELDDVEDVPEMVLRRAPSTDEVSKTARLRKSHSSPALGGSPRLKPKERGNSVDGSPNNSPRDPPHMALSDDFALVGLDSSTSSPGTLRKSSTSSPDTLVTPLA